MRRYFVKISWCEIYREGFYIRSIPDGTGKFQNVFLRVLLLENSRMFYLRARPVKKTLTCRVTIACLFPFFLSPSSVACF